MMLLMETIAESWGDDKQEQSISGFGCHHYALATDIRV
jgi:hypothetical protein